LRRGVELIRHRGDQDQAGVLQVWLDEILGDYRDHILSLDPEIAQVWGGLRVPHPENALDKQIAATALVPPERGRDGGCPGPVNSSIRGANPYPL
jgi:hypothetical protein